MFGTKDLSGTYWFCVTHRRVETFEHLDSSDRIGPFDNSSDAADALETIKKREKAYEIEDSKWESGD